MEGKDKLKLLEEQAEQYAQEYGKVDFTIITSRPEGMPYELYKFLRSASNKAVKEYLRRGNEGIK